MPAAAPKRWRSSLPLPSPGHGQVLAAVKAAGVNLFDTQLRSGLYKRDLPLTLGLEGAGIVEAVGADVDHIAVGDRVAFIFAAGSYATHTLAPAERVVPLPDKIGFEKPRRFCSRASPRTISRPRLFRSDRRRAALCIPPPAAAAFSCARSQKSAALK
jgi:Alcohol dehydrogenase GroES-like domain